MKYTVCIWLLWITATAIANTPTQDGDSLILYFNQVKETTYINQWLWNKDIYGPILVVDAATRRTFANEPDEEGVLSLVNGIYTGFLPREIPVSNTDVQWGGKHWAMLSMPLPEDRYERVDLMTHELFHCIQQSLGFLTRRTDNHHLELQEGRVYMRLEMKALEAALRSPRLIQAEEHLRNALLFRKYRHQVYRGAEYSENQLELLEGLATYTGQIMSGRDKWEWREYLLHRAVHFDKTPTFVRSFAYETVPIYGFFLFQKDDQWNLKVDNETVLTELFSEAFGMERRILLQSYVKQVAEEYDGRTIVNDEIWRTILYEQDLEQYREKFFDLPHLEIRLEEMNMSFDPRNLIPLDEDEGVVYPTIEISDNWGILTVEKGGALLRSDWRWVIISEPLGVNGRTITGEGWTIHLNEGYFMEEMEEGVYTISKTKE